MKLPRKLPRLLSQNGSLHFVIPLLFIVLFGIVGVGLLVYTHAATQSCGNDNGTGGTRIASEANRQWCIWSGGKNVYGQTVSHAQLISWASDNHYASDKNAWCADFVSYIYKNVGHPFRTRAGYASRNGWDWPRAYDLEHLPGFTYHTASSGYRPRVGDIAEFNYPGGHVEIVVATSPLTFVYGDTGSGGMAKNTYTSGHVLGYVTPN